MERDKSVLVNNEFFSFHSPYSTTRARNVYVLVSSPDFPDFFLQQSSIVPFLLNSMSKKADDFPPLKQMLSESETNENTFNVNLT